MNHPLQGLIQCQHSILSFNLLTQFFDFLKVKEQTFEELFYLIGQEAILLMAIIILDLNL